jgi:hypothetical protein
MEIPAKHGQQLFLNTTLLLYLSLQIMMTFSTPTGVYTQNPSMSVMAILQNARFTGSIMAE